MCDGSTSSETSLQMDGLDGCSDDGRVFEYEDWGTDASPAAQGFSFIQSLRINPPDRTYEVYKCTLQCMRLTFFANIFNYFATLRQFDQFLQNIQKKGPDSRIPIIVMDINLPET